MTSVPTEETTVLFEHGAISGGFSWAWVVTRLDKSVTSVAQSRHSTHLFDSAFRRIDFGAHRARLRDKARGSLDDRRVVIVGHSTGALLARAHANATGRRTIGIVYVDPSPPEQFDTSVDFSYQYPILRQELQKRVVRSLIGRAPTGSELASTSSLPAAARADASNALACRGFWMNALRETEIASKGWRDAAQFPERDPVPVAVVSSRISANPESLQNRFEEGLLESADVGRRFRSREASHESILHDEEHSILVNEAIEWVFQKGAGG